MARRDIQLFNLSTLDVLSGALGAVIFLFIIVPKGGASASQTTAQAALSFDIRHKQLWGEAADSLQNKKIGDTLLIVIKDLSEMPQAVPCPACPDCPGGVVTTKPRTNNNTNTVSPTTTTTTTPSTTSSTASTTTTTPTTTPPASTTPPGPTYNPETEKVIPIHMTAVEKAELEGLKRIEILPNVPCMVAFDIFWHDQTDNLDIFVKKGNPFVSGKPSQRSNPTIGKWESGVSRTKLFEKVDLRTNMEGVRQKDKIIPGTYEVYAQFKATNPKAPKSSVQVEGLFYTNDLKGNERGKRYKTTLPLAPNAAPQKIATITLRADGTFDFNQN